MMQIDLNLLDIKSGDPEVYERITRHPLQPTLDYARRLSDLGWDILRFWVYEIRDDLEGSVRRVFRPPLERTLTWPFQPHVTLLDRGVDARPKHVRLPSGAATAPRWSARPTAPTGCSGSMRDRR